MNMKDPFLDAIIDKDTYIITWNKYYSCSTWPRSSQDHIRLSNKFRMGPLNFGTPWDFFTKHGSLE